LRTATASGGPSITGRSFFAKIKYLRKIITQKKAELHAETKHLKTELKKSI